MLSETNRQVPGTEYYINIEGVVTNLKTGAIKKQQFINGYKTVSLSINKKQITRGIHRLLMIAFRPVKGMETLHINHKNGVRSDNRLENLEWCTPSQNASLPRHKMNKGVYSWGIGRNKFRVVIKVQGKAKTYGYFEKYEDALKCYENEYFKIWNQHPNNTIKSVELLINK